MIQAKIIADSLSAFSGTRITTFELEYPRFIHAELLTHRQFSRNSASSRAIPIDTMIDNIIANTAKPIHWGLNQSGMQAKDEQAPYEQACIIWLNARDSAIEYARQLQSLGLHKQIVNRVLEPYQMVKTLVTATNYDNFFKLRCHKDAQPEIQQLAKLMRQVYHSGLPEVLYKDEWHTPYVNHVRDDNNVLNYFVDDIQVDKETAIKISCSCAAQVSYRKNDTSIQKALAIFDKLVTAKPPHLSPFEHCATPMDLDEVSTVHTGDIAKGITGVNFITNDITSGNFADWFQYRQMVTN